MSDLDLNLPIFRWLMTELHEERNPQAFLQHLADKLVESDLPVDRIAFFIRSLHPTLMGRSFRWDSREGIEVTQAGYEVLAQDAYLKSPILAIYQSKELYIRHRLEQGEGLDEYPVLAELREGGATDYLIVGLPYLNGEIHAVSFISRKPGGFSEQQIQVLQHCRLSLARIAEIYTMRRIATTLLDTYLGHSTGERVLNGQIKRGDGNRIKAVVCFCDLRRSSALAETMEMERFLITLNEFYDCTATPIIENGGEILRFIGDAYLGIFPLDQFESAQDACRAALTAASEGVANLKNYQQSRSTNSPDDLPEPQLDGGFGLHIGEVLYGNIGTSERLEFTVIGTTANEAARLESRCKELGERILVSSQFAETLPGKWRDLGEFDARNISKPLRLFAPETDESSIL